METDSQTKIRINRWFSQRGVSSRKQADLSIKAGRVSVNGERATLGMTVSASDAVELDGRLITEQPKAAVILYHKPVGVVCTHRLDVAMSLENVLHLEQRVFAVGRLDKDSEGLLMLTNQGDLVNKIMKAEHKQPKRYRVWVDKPVSTHFINQMSEGVNILDTKTLPCDVIKRTETCFEIVLVQGLNRQIRRMCKALGYHVNRLQRTHIMDYDLSGLEVGATRHLSEQDVLALRTQLS